MHAEASEARPTALRHAYRSPTSPPEALPFHFTNHLERRRAAAALEEFRKLLQRPSSPDLLEQCIHRFGRHKQYEHMKKALSEYLNYGYIPSGKLWDHLLQVAGLAVKTPTDITPYVRQGLLAAIDDEQSLYNLIQYTTRYGLTEVGEELFLKYSERLKAESGSENAEPAPKFWALLVAGRARVADLDEAFAWFMRWRTSENHPCPTSKEALDMVEGSRDYIRRISSIVSHKSAMREAFAPLDPSLTRDDTGSSRDLEFRPIQQERAPDPAPYLALLKALSRPNDIPSQYLLELMATDGLPLTTLTMNGLIENEFTRQEKGQLASVLALYDKMRTNPDPAYQPDVVTFYTIFQTYREPRQLSSIRNLPPQPTILARKAELPPPPPEYMLNPRTLLLDMCNTHTRRSQDQQWKEDTGSGFIDSQVLAAAVGAFVRTRDFVGCAAALSIYKILRIEPTAQIHAVITLGLLRARTRREAFQRRDQGYYMLDEEAARLQKHVDHLNDLVGFEKPIIVRGQQLSLPKFGKGPPPKVFAIQSNISEVTRRDKILEMRTWNERIVPRSMNETRSTQRYELRHIAPLVELLRRASGTDVRTWKKDVIALEETIARELAVSLHG